MKLTSANHQPWSGRFSVADITGWTGTILPGTSSPILMNLCRYEGESRSLILRIDAYGQSSLKRVEPYARRKRTYFAGGQDLSETYYAYQPNVACYVELGFGAATQQLFFDWSPGAYQLPACEFALVQALFYGPVFSDTAVTFAASVTPGETINGKLPTRTQRHRVAASDSTSVRMSIYTRAIEILAETGDVWTATGNGVYIKRDMATPSLIPSVSPVPVIPDSSENQPDFTLSNGLASQQDVTVVEYLDFGG